MHNFKTTFILIAIATLGILVGLVGLVPFYPVSWASSIAFALFVSVLLIQLLTIEEADFECGLRKKPALVFAVLGLVVAVVLVSRDSPIALPLVVISAAKNLCFWLVIFEIYLFVKLYTPAAP